MALSIGNISLQPCYGENFPANNHFHYKRGKASPSNVLPYTVLVASSFDNVQYTYPTKLNLAQNNDWKMSNYYFGYWNCFIFPSGEGMKIGALALLRNKRHVSVQTSLDSWRFGLKQHSVLQEEVLTVFVSSKLTHSDTGITRNY